MAFRLSRTDHSIAEGLLRMVGEQAGKAARLAVNADLTPAKRVHEARRRTKKLRALLRLVRADLPAYAEENRALRDASRALSGARDASVMLETLDDLLRWAGHAVPDRDAAAAPELPDGALESFAAELWALTERSAGWKVSRIDVDTVSEGLAANYRRAIAARRTAVETGDETDLHEWRKYTKYYWNQLGLLREVAPDVLPSQRSAAGELAELLGTHHDLAVLAEAVRQGAMALPEGIDQGLVLSAAARRQAELETRIEQLGNEVFAETPKALRQRFAAYLDGWATAEAAG